MSQPPSKKKQFVLPSALKNLHQHKQAQTQNFIKELDNPDKHQKPSKKQHKSTSLFKLNPDSNAIISQVPIDTLRKRSKSQKIQHMNEEQQEAFSLLEHKRQYQTKKIKDKHAVKNNYQIDVRQKINDQEREKVSEEMDVQEEEEYQTVKPSQTFQVKKDIQDSIFQPTIFQTPILPCFASEFRQQNPEMGKKIRQGEGLWRIGKMRVKDGKPQLRIGEFVFQGCQIPAAGKAGVLSKDPNRETANDKLFMLPNWRNLCIMQPHQTIFSQ